MHQIAPKLANKKKKENVNCENGNEDERERAIKRNF